MRSNSPKSSSGSDSSQDDGPPGLISDNSDSSDSLDLSADSSDLSEDEIESRRQRREHLASRGERVARFIKDSKDRSRLIGFSTPFRVQGVAKPTGPLTTNTDCFSSSPRDGSGASSEDEIESLRQRREHLASRAERIARYNQDRSHHVPFFQGHAHQLATHHFCK
jgi:hypothetical protein